MTFRSRVVSGAGERTGADHQRRVLSKSELRFIDAIPSLFFIAARSLWKVLADGHVSPIPDAASARGREFGVQVRQA